MLHLHPGAGRRLSPSWSVLIPIATIAFLVMIAVANLPDRTRSSEVLPPAGPQAPPTEAAPSPEYPAGGSQPAAPASPSVDASASAVPASTPARKPATGTKPPAAPPPPPGVLIVAIGGRCVAAGDGGLVQLAICNSRAINQRWIIPGDGSVRTLGRCLDTDNSDTVNRTPVVVSRCDGTSSQRWAVLRDGTFVQDRSGKCLDVFEGFTDPGTPLVIFTCKGSQNQRFGFA